MKFALVLAAMLIAFGAVQSAEAKGHKGRKHHHPHHLRQHGGHSHHSFIGGPKIYCNGIAVPCPPSK
ncbi:MAG: hypothetical protein KGO53_01990 [Alphaproteobacteria bacterium]|nr:hypothetical protein [Alphaproteobacteria bacterium]